MFFNLQHSFTVLIDSIIAHNYGFGRRTATIMVGRRPAFFGNSDATSS